jgi:hypothetical protein
MMCPILVGNAGGARPAWSLQWDTVVRDLVELYSGEVAVVIGRAMGVAVVCR